jgi:hypothetical protein
MEKASMAPDKGLDLEAWDRRLDSGDRSDPLLDMAAEIRARRPMSEGPTLAFQDRLRTRLLADYGRRPPVRRPSSRRLIAWGLAGLALVVLTFAGLRQLPGRVPPVSAAEILELASGRLSEQLSSGDVIYDRLVLDWDQGGSWKQQGVGAELWRSPDGSRLRYQMYAGSGLLYFEQHDGERLWRSSYVRGLEGGAIKVVYQAPYVPASGDLEDKQLAAQLLFQDLSDFWIHIDQMTGAGRAGCAELFCALGALGQGWECSETRCTLNLGPIFGTQDYSLQAEVAAPSRLPNGREVYAVRLAGPDWGDTSYTALKFDTNSFDLLEIEDIRQGKLHYRVSLAERQALAWTDLPEGFFQSVPDGIEVRVWTSDIPLGHKLDDRVWIESADPPSGAALSGTLTATLELGYRLTSIEAAAIVVGLSWVGHDTPYALRDATVPISAGEGTVPLTINIDTGQLGDGPWAVNVWLTDVTGIAPPYGWSGGGAPLGINLEWCIRCPPPIPEP